jgi:hypothetical protein
MFALSRRSFMLAGTVTVIGSVKAWVGSSRRRGDDVAPVGGNGVPHAPYHQIKEEAS